MGEGLRHPKRLSHVAAREVDGELVIYDRGKGLIHQLNETARLVWEMCDGGSELRSIARQLSERFEVEPKVAEKDVARIVSEFKNLGLVRLEESHAVNVKN